MNDFPHRFERTLFLKASAKVVFRPFTNSESWAAWWGEGSTLDARPGGAMRIVHPGGTEVRGSVVSITPNQSIVFTYGYASGKPIAEGDSRVSVSLEAASGGTQLHLWHECRDAEARDLHAQGWRYQLSLFANAVMDELHRDVTRTVDEWFSAWSNTDAAERKTQLTAIAGPEIRFSDRFGAIDGLEDLLIHTAAIHKFMPGTKVEREGAVRHCQGKVLADWTAASAGGHPAGRGANLFVIASDGRIEDVTGFWSPSAEKG